MTAPCCAVYFCCDLLPSQLGQLSLECTSQKPWSLNKLFFHTLIYLGFLILTESLLIYINNQSLFILVWMTICLPLKKSVKQFREFHQDFEDSLYK